MSDPVPVNTQVLNALAALISAADIDAVFPVHIGRSDVDPFEIEELPAVNLLIVDEGVSAQSRQGAARGVQVLELNRIQIVVQVVTRGTPEAESKARLISAQIQQAVALNPTLGDVCRETLYPIARQWLRDDGASANLARQNTLYQGEYRNWSTDPFTLA